MRSGFPWVTCSGPRCRLRMLPHLRYPQQTEIKVHLETAAEPAPMADVSSGRKKLLLLQLLGMMGGCARLLFTQDTYPESPPPPSKPSSLADLLKTTVGDSSPRSEELPRWNCPPRTQFPCRCRLMPGSQCRRGAGTSGRRPPCCAPARGWAGPHTPEAVTNAELSEVNNNGLRLQKFFWFLHEQSHPTGQVGECA